MARRQALGRGLKALMPDSPQAKAGLTEVPVAKLVANPNQPRQHFDAEALAELSASLAEHGVLQPLLVSQDEAGGYMVIAGERRLRAARLAGLETVPVVIRERLQEGQELELALVENLQRRDLTPLEEARAYVQLREQFNLVQREIAARVGIDRSTVANALRLLKLPTDVQQMIESGELSAGHARSLLAFATDEERTKWAGRVVDSGMSVRELERIVSSSRDIAEKKNKKKSRPTVDPNMQSAAQRLSRRLGSSVDIRARGKGGQIIVSCATQDELMRVFDVLMEEN
ncbi:MAG: ParB/RepB/Spo0J family partition protein [bacterium]|nr:ParB/RepB/Spo0J family partition protein [bacterium]